MSDLPERVWIRRRPDIGPYLMGYEAAEWPQHPIDPEYVRYVPEQKLLDTERELNHVTLKWDTTRDERNDLLVRLDTLRADLKALLPTLAYAVCVWDTGQTWVHLHDVEKTQASFDAARAILDREGA